MAGRARSTSHRVFVRPAVPLPLDALDSYFSRFGQVTDVYAPKSSSRPVAFVSFLDPEAVHRPEYVALQRALDFYLFYLY